MRMKCRRRGFEDVRAEAIRIAVARIALVSPSGPLMSEQCTAECESIGFATRGGAWSSRECVTFVKGNGRRGILERKPSSELCASDTRCMDT